MKNIGKQYLSTAADIAKIVAERDKAIESNGMLLSPMVSSQLIRMSHLDFCNIVASEQGL